jgi:luciferase family oxidoreductase group 1
LRGEKGYPEEVNPLHVGLLNIAQFSLRQTLDLAQIAERYGYHRYWLAEHLEPNYHHASALTMTGLIAVSTERIRVGPAGVLLKVHAPFHVASSGALLAGVFSGRIDLGMAGALPPQKVLSFLGVQSAPGREEYERMLTEVSALFAGSAPIPLRPQPKTPPQLWHLSSSGGGAALAGRLGAGFALSILHSPKPPPAEAFAPYLEAFSAAHGGEPRTCLALTVLCAESEEEARRQLAVAPGFGIGAPVVGAPEGCAEQIRAAAERYGAGEVVLLPVNPTASQERAAVRLLAGALGLEEVEER